MKVSRILLLVASVGIGLCLHDAALGQNPPREIVTIGHAVLNSKPSILVLEIAVVGAGPTAEDAKTRAGSKTEALVSDFRRFGIKPDDWERSLSVARRPLPEEPKRVAFWVTSKLIARIDDFTSAVEMLDRATAQEVASIHFRFEPSDIQAEYEKALKRALADARFKAEALAAEAGVKLGPLVGCEELSGMPKHGPPQAPSVDEKLEKKSENEPPVHQQAADLRSPVVVTAADVRARFAIVE